MTVAEILIPILGSSFGAALVSGLFAIAQHFLSRREKKAGSADAQRKALRYLMLYIIQERAKQHILEGNISLEDRRALHHWHSLYHDGLGGNGDADALMEQVDRLGLKTEAF